MQGWIPTGWVLGMLVAACAATPDQGATQRGTPARDVGSTPKRVVASIMDDPPQVTSTMAPPAIRGLDALDELVHVGLATVEPRGGLTPRLAEAVPSIENGFWVLTSGGRMETTWRLRPGATWHDGTSVRIDDFLFTIAIVQDPDMTELRDPIFDLIEGARAADERTLVVTWARPFIDADRLFTRAGPRGAGTLQFPKHILEKPYLEAKARFAQEPYWTTEFVGTGPFKVKEWVPGSHIILAANDAYPLGRPKIDEIEVRFVPDPNALLASVMAGTVQVTLGRGLNLEQAIVMREQWRDGRAEINPASWIIIWPQLLNPTPSVVSDVRFRRAAAHAIDRQQLVDTLAFGLTSVAHSYLGPNEPTYREIEPSIVRYEYDPRRSAALLEEIGYSKGLDGMLRDGAGQRLAMEVRTSGGDTLREQLLLAVTGYWQQAGMAAEPVVFSRQLAQDPTYFYTFPSFLLSRNPNTPENLSSFHSRAAAVAENNFRGSGGANYPRYFNADFDALNERYYVTIAKGERTPILRDIVAHIATNVLTIGLFYSTDQNLIADRLVNVGGRVSRATESWNAHEWDIK